MPTYDYQCKKCGHRFELFHSIKDETTKRCPKCRSKAVRVPSGGAGLLFKGSGFYITDYRSSSYKEGANQDKGKAKDGGSSSKESKSGGESSGKDSSSSKTKRGSKSAGSD
jgi:putative FmdB family regulatory protein